jgi:excisionase family DNA binding protein
MPDDSMYSDPASAPLATVADVAAYMAVSRSKVYQLMETGELPYIKLGKCRRIFWTDVQALLTQNRVGRP